MGTQFFPPNAPVAELRGASFRGKPDIFAELLLLNPFGALFSLLARALTHLNFIVLGATGGGGALGLGEC